MKYNKTPEQFDLDIQKPEFKIFGFLTVDSGITFKRKDDKLICSYWRIQPAFNKLCETSFPFQNIPKTWDEFVKFSNKVIDHFQKYSENALFLIDIYQE